MIIRERYISSLFFDFSGKLSRSPSPSTNRADRIDRERNERIDRNNLADRADRCDRDRKDRSDRVDRCDQPDRSNRADRNERVIERMERVARIDQVDHMDRTARDRLNRSDVCVNNRNRPDRNDSEDWDRAYNYRSSQRYCDPDVKIHESRLDESPTRY